MPNSVLLTKLLLLKLLLLGEGEVKKGFVMI